MPRFIQLGKVGDGKSADSRIERPGDDFHAGPGAGGACVGGALRRSGQRLLQHLPQPVLPVGSGPIMRGAELFMLRLKTAARVP
jgi:hypothetical protein